MLTEAVERARAVRDDLPLGIFIMIAAGADAATRAFRSMLGNGFFSRVAGSRDAVGEALCDLGQFGFDRVQLTPMLPNALEAVRPNLGLG